MNHCIARKIRSIAVIAVFAARTLCFCLSWLLNFALLHVRCSLLQEWNHVRHAHVGRVVATRPLKATTITTQNTNNLHFNYSRSYFKLPRPVHILYSLTLSSMDRTKTFEDNVSVIMEPASLGQ